MMKMTSEYEKRQEEEFEKLHLWLKEVFQLDHVVVHAADDV